MPMHLIRMLAGLFASGVLVLAQATPSAAPAAGQPAAPPPPSAEAQTAYQEALQLMNGGAVKEALTRLETITGVDAAHPAILNLRGALQVRNRELAAAAASFGAILEKEPSNGIALFNLGEVHFLQRDYAKSKSFFTRFMELTGNGDNALGRYKIFLCELKGGNAAAADKILAGLEPTISHPFYYFAHAAADFHRGKEDSARDYIRSAFGIYAGGLNAAFADSLVELGYLKPEEIAQIGAIDAAALQSLSQEFRPGDGGPGGEKLVAPVFEDLLPEFAREKKDEAAPAPKAP